MGLGSSTVVSEVINWIDTTCPVRPILHEAAHFGNEEAVRVLVDNGADINARGYLYESPLHTAALSKFPGTFKVMKYLVERGAFLDVEDSAGRTPLFAACVNQNLAKANLLIDSNCGLAHKAHDGNGVFQEIVATAHSAALRGLFPELCRRGLDPHEPHNKETPIHRAMTIREYASLLLNSDYGVESLTWFVWRPRSQNALHTWVGDVFRLYRRRIPLENLRAMASRSDPDEISALYWAASVGCEVGVRNMVELGVDLDAQGGPMGTALIIASQQGHLEVVKILVRAGASISYRGDGGIISAIRAAAHFQSVVDWLLVNRFVEQERLQSTGDISPAETTEIHPWSGFQRRMMQGAEWTRWYEESWVGFLGRINKLKRDMRGKIVPIPISVEPGEVSVNWVFEKETSRAVHVQMNLKGKQLKTDAGVKGA